MFFFVAQKKEKGGCTFDAWNAADAVANYASI
jgi:hypothetical protein